MLAMLLKRAFRKFGGRYGYDTSYLAELADTDTAGALKLALVSPFTDHRFGLAAAPYFAARITAARQTDCGSCLRLTIAMAREAGVSMRNIRAMLLDGAETAPRDMALARHYAEAVLASDPALPNILAACEALWGKSGVAGLAAATVSGSFYPLLKRGLGHGNACEPVLAWLAGEATEETMREMVDG
ncbi:MAG TPA: hypothetical protein VGV39_07660 [Mesorhizobium sp.]|jgi:hypothetical protein|uniref:hypothetical protein n=1 Tax=Mesorhizobium sp. TaxID=1871066 RepID=UPI002DDCBC9E|nr:hypothetical protein [Mesorhizobium sp.]HEV2502936.1 hypothetical protein [Mesorhizobium sp.]